MSIVPAPQAGPTGHQVHFVNGRIGGQGGAYTYVLAGNGVWLEARSSSISARVLLASAEVRGLPPLSQDFYMPQGRLPVAIWHLIGDALLGPSERFGAVVWNHQYHLVCPPQEGRAASVSFSTVPDAVLEVHTHPRMSAFFSGTDNADEQGFKLYGVLGVKDGGPAVRLRLGIYGYFLDIPWRDVFEGSLGAWHDMVAEEIAEGGS